ncbi:hypothetical protein H0X06_05920 [Candidatus Dependentiae bacterium]|nr:hypothetical protein [Candidatus Dependentiae bacterium]
MVKCNMSLMVMISFCSSWNSVHGVLVEGSKWVLDEKKEIVYFFDIHNQVEWKDREKDELEDLVQIFKEVGQSSGKPVHILIEEVWNPYRSSDNILSMLSTRLARENLTSGLVIENIELRASSAIVQDLIGENPDNSPLLPPRVSSTEVFYPDEVTFSDVLHEFFFIRASLEESYKESCDKLKEIHNEKMSFLQSYEKQLTQIFQVNGIDLDKPVALLLEECLTQEKRDIYNTLRTVIHTISNSFIDLYAFHRVLAISSEYKVVLIAGGEHSMWVKCQIMSRLDALRECRYGNHGSGLVTEEDIMVPLTTEQLKSVLYA